MYQRIVTVNVHTNKANILKYGPEDIDIDHEGYVEYVDGKRDIGVMVKNILVGVFFIAASIALVPLEPQEAGILPLLGVPAGIATIISTIRGGNPFNW